METFQSEISEILSWLGLFHVIACSQKLLGKKKVNCRDVIRMNYQLTLLRNKQSPNKQSCTNIWTVLEYQTTFRRPSNE